MALESCSVFFARPQPFAPGETSTLRAQSWRPMITRKKFCWLTPCPRERSFGAILKSATATSWAGTLTTAGDLVFFANDTGALEAVEARTGHPLWQFNTGQSIRASPMSYAVDGVQYVAIAAGGDVISFSLPH